MHTLLENRTCRYRYIIYRSGQTMADMYNYTLFPIKYKVRSGRTLPSYILAIYMQTRTIKDRMLASYITIYRYGM